MATKKEPQRYVAYLWDDLTLEQQEAALEQARLQLERKQRTRLPKKTKAQVARYRPEEDYGQMADEVAKILGLQLDDGWMRLCCLHTYETLVFYIRERYEVDWVKAYSKNWKATKDMKIWPEGAKSKVNPWKFNVIHEVQLLPIQWFEELGQYKVEFQFDKGVTQTFWFPPQFRHSGLGKGWMRPRRISKTFPFNYR